MDIRKIVQIKTGLIATDVDHSGLRILGIGLMVAGLSMSSVWAAGPLDGSVGIEWWNTQYSGSLLDGDLDAGSFSARAETWWGDSWGLKGAFYSADLEQGNLQDQQRFSLDLKRRLISPTENTFLAAGIGWENIQMEAGGSSSGLRLSLDGRVGLVGMVSLYGQAAWMPSLGDTNGFSDISGMEFETGVVLDPLPFLSIRAGFRQFDLDYNSGGDSGATRASGVILGTGFHW